MNEERAVLTIRILEKDYVVSCPPDERDGLLTSARELNERMWAMRDGGKVLGPERMAVMAALNVIHEREQITTRRSGTLDSAQEHIRRLERKLDAEIGRRGNNETLNS